MTTLQPNPTITLTFPNRNLDALDLSFVPLSIEIRRLSGWAATKQHSGKDREKGTGLVIDHVILSSFIVMVYLT